MIEQLPCDDDRAFVEAARSLGRIVVSGSVLPGHPLDSGVVYRIEPRNGGLGVRDADELVIYSTTEMEFGCHTDGYCSSDPADFVLLLCVRADSGGGTSYLVHVEDVLARFDPADASALRDPVFPSLVGPGPILFDTPAGVGIRFNEREINRTPESGKTAYTPRHAAAVARLAAATQFAHARHRLRLQPGECLIIDNRRVLHGRDSLSPGSNRLLKRLWVSGGREELWS